MLVSTISSSAPSATATAMAHLLTTNGLPLAVMTTGRPGGADGVADGLAVVAGEASGTAAVTVSLLPRMRNERVAFRE